MYATKGIFNVRMVMCSPSLPPQSVHPQRDTARTKGIGRDTSRTRLARSTEEEERAQIIHELEMRNTDWGHIESRSSSPMEDEGTTGCVQQGDRSSNGEIYPRMEQERRPTSPPTKTFDDQAQAESTAPESSRQGGRRGTQTRRRVSKDGLVYKRRKWALSMR